MRTLRFMLLAALWLLAVVEAKSAQTLIEGVVLGPDQRPVPDVQVQIYSSQSSWQDLQSTPLATQTDSNGHFSVMMELGLQTVVIAKKNGLSCGWDYIGRDKHKVKLLLTEPKAFSGQVVDSDGKPVSEALVQTTVVSTSPKGTIQGNALIFHKAFDLLSTRTDAQGRFVFPDFPAEAGLEIRIIKAGYALFFSAQPSSPQYTYKAGTAGLVFTLDPEAVLEGTVIDAKTTQPIADIPLSLTSRRGGTLSNLPGYNVRTDDKGRFSYRGLYADSYSVTFASHSGESYLYATRQIELNKGQVYKDCVLKLSSGGVLDITVKDVTTQQPINEVRVEVADNKSMFPEALKGDALGRITKHYEPGNYRITLVSAQGYNADTTERPFTIEQDKSASFNITLVEYPSLEGIFVDPDGTPAENCDVQILYFKPYTHSQNFNRSGPPTKTRTDREGHFTLWIDATDKEVKEGPGAYPVYAYDTKRNLFFSDSVPFGQKNTTLPLKPGIKVVGSIVDQYGAAVGDASISISISFKTGQSSSFGTSVNVTSGPDGRFECAGIPTHPQTLGVSFYAKGYKQFSGNIDPGQIRDGVIKLKPIPVHRADVVIKGKVVFDNGDSAVGVKVNVTDFTSGYASTQTDEQGNFELTVLDLPVEITANKTCEHGVNYSGKTRVTEKNQDVTITIQAPNTKKTFLPVVDPNQ